MIAADWNGAYTLPARATPVAISVHLHGSSATVALGPGHSGATTVAVVVRGTTVHFAFPGLPSNVVFDGAVRGGILSGTVRQGALRGRFTLRRGTSRLLPLLGVYRTSADAGAGAAIVQATGFVPWLVEMPSGATHGISSSLTVGHEVGDTKGNGAIAPDANGFTWNGTHYTRVALRRREVRVGVDAATLTLPAGPGPFAAVAMVHGSGPATREEFQTFGAYLELLGIAVLADDKRGVGESTGVYPGERATESTIDVLARDAQDEVRFLTTQPQIDPKRVGLFGDSQAGWIIPLAASRAPAVRFAVAVVGPTVTVGETDVWGSLAGEGQTPPTGSRASMLAQVRQNGQSGVDPAPALRKLSIPMHWIFGSDDRNVPTELCVERLDGLAAGHDYTWTVLPMTHTPFVLPTGLLASLPQSPGFVAGFFPDLGAWLGKRGLG